MVCADHAEQRASRSPGARRGAAQRGPRVESKEDVERLDKSALNDAIRCFWRSRYAASAWLFFPGGLSSTSDISKRDHNR